MVKKFRGQVKISDVQREFNDIINTINTIVDTYNKSKYVKEIDYTVGDKFLGNAGYTLTVGGLKQVMKAMNGTVIGAKVFEITPNKKYKISDGVLITESKIYRLPDRVVNVPSNITKVESIYYNANTDEYEFSQSKVTTMQKVEVPALDLEKDSEGNYLLSESTDWGKISCKGTLTLNSGSEGMDLFSGLSGSTSCLKTETIDVPNLGSKAYTFITGTNDGNGFHLNKFPHKSLPDGINAFNLKTLCTSEDEYNYTLSNCGMVLGYYFVKEDTEYFLPLIVANTYNYGSYDSGAMDAFVSANPNGLTLKYDRGSVITTDKCHMSPQNSSYPEDETYGGGNRLKPNDATSYEAIDPAWNWEVHYDKLGIKTMSDDPNTGRSDYFYDKVRAGDDIGSGIEIKTFNLWGRWSNVQYNAVYKTSVQGKYPEDKLVSNAFALDKSGNLIQLYGMRNSDCKPLPEIVAGVRQCKPVMTLLDANTRVDTGIGKDTKILEACNMAIYSCGDFKSKSAVDGYAMRPNYYSPKFDTGTSIIYKEVKGVDDPNSFKITDIAPSRKSIYKNDIKNVQVEDIFGKYKINSQDTTFPKSTWGYGNGYPYGEENTDTSSEAKFVSGMEANQASNNSNNYYELVFGDGNYLVSSNAQNGKHKNAYLQLINFLYVPKGVKQPYKVKDGDRAIIKGINVVENLNLGEDY